MQNQEADKPSQFKQKLFDFTKELVSNQMSINIYYVFIIIESLQFLGYHCNGLIEYNTIGMSELTQVLRFINLLPLMLEKNMNILLVPIFFVISAFHLSIAVYGYRAYDKKITKIKKSIEDRNFHKNRLEYFINFLMVCFNTFLTIPIFQTSVTAIYCSDSLPYTAVISCYDTPQISILILAIFNLCWLLITNIYFSLYYYSRNPFYTNFLTCSSNWWNLGKFIIKIIPMGYLLYDPQLDYPILFLIMMNGVYFAYLALFKIFLPFYRYNFNLEKFIFFNQSLTSLMNLSLLIVYTSTELETFDNGDKNVFLILWFVSSFLFSYAALSIFEKKKKHLSLEVHSLQKNKLQQVLQYLIYLIYQTQKSFSLNKGTVFMSYLGKTHQQNCDKFSCYCRKYQTRIKNKNYYKQKQVFYFILLAIIDRVIQQNKKAYSFFILKAYILYYKLSSEIKAATTISIIMSDKLQFSDDMLVKGLLFQLNQQYVDTRDMEVYRKFNEYLFQQEEKSLVIVNYYLKYWEELMDQNSSLPKLHEILMKIREEKNEIQQTVYSSLDIYHNHVRVLFLYKNFLKQVLNDYVGYLRYEQKYKVGLKQHKLTNVDAANTIQFRPNENLIVINFTRHYSTNSEILGNFLILNLSSNIKQILGFSNTQLKNQSINKLIPRIYHTVHDQYIDRILDKPDSQIISRQIRIFPINSIGQLIECNIISKYMPSVEYGINIVSFIEQCDVFKDQFFIIYDSKSGIVDSMNQGAERLLKDASRRKTNDLLSIPDHINELVPNWDYKNQVWKEHLGKGKSARSIGSITDIKNDVKEIEIIRSDGLKSKDIKILKFKGDFFIRMLSFQNNFQSYKESNTIQQYLDFRKENTYSKMDSGQLQEIISMNTSKIFERDKQKKKTFENLKKVQKNSPILIDKSPSRASKGIFIALQICLFIFATGLTTFQFIISNTNITQYLADSDFLMSVNTIQFQTSNAVYLVSLICNQIALQDNYPLLYSKYKLTVPIPDQTAELNAALSKIDSRIKEVTTIFVQKIQLKQLSQQLIALQVMYLLDNKINKYYLKNTDLVQSVLQLVQYLKDFANNINNDHNKAQQIIRSPSTFFVLYNSIKILPLQLTSIREHIVKSIEGRLQSGFNVFLIIKLVNSFFIIASVVATIIYYRYIYDNSIFAIVKMYECIKIDQIKVYQQKCLKYKLSLSEKEEMSEKDNKNGQSGQTIRRLQPKAPSNESLTQNIIEADEQKQLLVDEQNKEEIERLLNFQATPNLFKKYLTFSIWVILYGTLAFTLCYIFSNGTSQLKTQIKKLNKYGTTQNSVIQLRSFTQLSLNIFNYWDKQWQSTINSQLNSYFMASLKGLDDEQLQYADLKPIFSKKYESLHFVKQLVLNNKSQDINNNINQILMQLEEMDNLLNKMSQKTILYLPIVQGSSNYISNNMNICICIGLLFIIIYWLVGVRSAYLELMRQHEFAYEMYHIIGYNLRKELQKK